MKNLKTAIKISSALVLLIIVISSSSCKKSGVSPSTSNNPAPNATQVSFSVLSDSAPAVLASGPFASLAATASAAAAPVIKFTSGVANITKFEFEAKKNGAKVSFETQNLANVDLFALNPTFIKTLIDTGLYSEIEVRMILSQSTTSAIPLTLMGTATTAAGSVPFEFDFNQNLEIKSESQNVVVSHTKTLKSLFLLHLNMILSTITADDLAAATLTNGTIVVSSTSNATIFNKIVANLGSVGDTKFEEVNDGGDDVGKKDSEHGSGHN